MAGLRAIEAKGYFDVEVVCEGPFARPPKPVSLTACKSPPARRWERGRCNGYRPTG